MEIKGPSIIDTTRMPGGVVHESIGSQGAGCPSVGLGTENGSDDKKETGNEKTEGK